MSDAPPINDDSAMSEARAHKLVVDNSWTFVTVLAAALVVLCWYFHLGQVSVGPVIWTLSGLAVTQLAINSRAQRVGSSSQLRLLTLASQIVGTALMGVAWHLCGGLQQPF